MSSPTTIPIVAKRIDRRFGGNEGKHVEVMVAADGLILDGHHRARAYKLEGMKWYRCTWCPPEWLRNSRSALRCGAWLLGKPPWIAGHAANFERGRLLGRRPRRSRLGFDSRRGLSGSLSFNPATRPASAGLFQLCGSSYSTLRHASLSGLGSSCNNAPCSDGPG